MLMARN